MIQPVPPTLDWAHERLQSRELVEIYGRVRQVVGLVLESDGPYLRLGDVCLVHPGHDSMPLACEVVGFKQDRLLLMPLGEMSGIHPGCLVHSAGGCLRVPVGEQLLGRTLDGLGNPIDGLGLLGNTRTYPVYAAPPNALQRQMITQPFLTGVRALDGLMTLGIGQRVGIFAGSGVGKSTLLGMIARGGSADVNVIALVGERGREVREFIQNDLGEEGLRKSVVICATSDQPALVRIKAALAATAIAESFRDQGLNVLFMMDSVTRFAMAQREVGLAIGEPPSTKGYTPSVFALLPRLLERAGCGAKGAITAIYTVLVEGDDTNEPIADAVRAILDGHIVLDRSLTSKGHYPPIAVTDSLSRVMPMVVPESQIRAANAFRELIAAYKSAEDLISIGAYKSGSQPLTDKAIARWEAMNQFLCQDMAEAGPFDDTLSQLMELTSA